VEPGTRLRNRRRRVFVCVALALAALAGAGARAGATPAPGARLTLEPCEVPGVAGKVRCGELAVYENRTARSGRKLRLKILVLHATGKDPAPDPLVFLEGGPGESATEDAAGLAAGLAKIRERRDILLVDQRGTGGSHPLNCVLFEPTGDLQSSLREFFPLAAVKKCRPALEKDADLTQYTTPIAVDDLDEVRVALGYEKLNLYGVSYGTRAALVYLSRHGRRVRTVTLVGVSPTDQEMPLHFPRDTERALNGVLDECVARAPCRAAFPDVKTDQRALIDRLKADAISVEIVDPDSGEVSTVRLSRDVAAEALRYMLYSPAFAGQIPALLRAAATDDFTSLAEMALFFRRHLVATGSMGLYLSITCAEDLPAIDPHEAERLAESTALGDYRYIQQRAACEIWPRANLPAGYRRPVHSRVPALILSGAWDPVTPPEYGRAAAQSLARSLHIVVPHGGHGFEGLENADCVDRLVADFIERGTTTGIDTRCVASIERPPFTTQVPPLKPITMTRAELEPFVGSYTNGDSLSEATIEFAQGHLRLTRPDRPATILLPVSPTRLRVVEDPFTALQFELEDGRVRRVVLEEGGVPQLTLQPKR
jgi:pimeloyl-ACP methyl ester carboxylesterase